MEPVAMICGDVRGKSDVPVRVHDQCMTSEVFGSMRCDCKQQLEAALMHVHSHRGVVIYLQQEGRGIGLANKVAAYQAQQEMGLDTVDANLHLGFEEELRSYGPVRDILSDIGVKSIKLLTNNPYKVKSLKSLGVDVASVLPMPVIPNRHNIDYLRTKIDRMDHNEGLIDEKTDAGLPATPDGANAVAGADGWCFGRHTVVAALEAVRDGRPVVVVDDEDRENEGDLIMAAEHVTQGSMAFIIRHSSGVICAGMEQDRLAKLRLPQMVPNNEDPKQTAFTLSVDAKVGTSTGISAADRALTMRLLADPKSVPEQFNRPGHIFPLRARTGGVLKREGHTEATVDLMKLAGLQPVGVLCEISNDDGTMARLPELRVFAKKHGLVLTSIADLKRYKMEAMGRNR